MSDVEDANPQAYDTKNKSISRKCPDCLSLGIQKNRNLPDFVFLATALGAYTPNPGFAVP